MPLGGSGSSDWERTDKLAWAAWGAAFTIAVDAVLYPLEVVKTRLQVDTQTPARSSPMALARATGAALRASLAPAGGGVAGLYRGFALYSFGGLPSQGAYFMTYAAAKDALRKANEGGALPDAAVHLAAGLAADVVAAPLCVAAPGCTANGGRQSAASCANPTLAPSLSRTRAPAAGRRRTSS